MKAGTSEVDGIASTVAHASRNLVSRAVIVELVQTCNACPSQWEGRLADGRSIYIRFRHGELRATCAQTIEDAITYGAADLLAASFAVLDLPPKTSAKERRRQAHAHAASTRAGLLGGEMLLREQLPDDADDGCMQTEEMLTRLQRAGVFCQRQ